jgi:hypothetical protein
MKIKHEEVLQILSDHGASVDFSTQVAMMPPGLVENISKMPAGRYLYEPEKKIPVFQNL